MEKKLLFALTIGLILLIFGPRTAAEDTVARTLVAFGQLDTVFMDNVIKATANNPDELARLIAICDGIVADEPSSASSSQGSADGKFKKPCENVLDRESRFTRKLTTTDSLTKAHDVLTKVAKSRSEDVTAFVRKTLAKNPAYVWMEIRSLCDPCQHPTTSKDQQGACETVNHFRLDISHSIADQLTSDGRNNLLMAMEKCFGNFIQQISLLPETMKDDVFEDLEHLQHYENCAVGEHCMNEDGHCKYYNLFMKGIEAWESRKLGGI